MISACLSAQSTRTKFILSKNNIVRLRTNNTNIAVDRHRKYLVTVDTKSTNNLFWPVAKPFLNDALLFVTD